MTDQELKDIVAAVVAELEKSGVDFDYKAEQAKDDDLVFVIRGTAPNYQGVTVTWKGLLDIITAQATQAKNDAETAKNTANTILEQVQSKGTEITNFVATSKAELETQKNESVNAVKSVYQTDLNELKGDLCEQGLIKENGQFSFENANVGYVRKLDGEIGGSSGSGNFHYKSFKVPKGTKIDVHLGNVQTNVAYIATSQTDLVSTCDYVVPSVEGTFDYSYVTENETYVVLSKWDYDANYKSTFVKPIKNDVNVIKENVDVLISNNIYDYLPLFHNVVCIGDSLTRGYNGSYEVGSKNRDFGYPWVLSRRTRLNVYNYGRSGATPTTWFDALGTNDYSSFDMAIICLGRNGGISSNEDKTSYQNIINKLKSDNEHMTIFICSLPALYDSISDEDVAINNRIKTIADTNNIPYIDIWGDYGNAKYRTEDVHFKSIGYMMMCDAIINGINKYIDANIDDYLNLWMPNTLDNYIDGLIQ